MSTKLFVGGLSYDLQEEELTELFAPLGTIVGTVIIHDRATGMSKGFGFVEMSSAEEAAAAIDALNGTELRGRTLTVNEARPREERPPRNNNFGNRN